jgi:hypothetical protein
MSGMLEFVQPKSSTATREQVINRIRSALSEIDLDDLAHIHNLIYGDKVTPEGNGTFKVVPSRQLVPRKENNHV